MSISPDPPQPNLGPDADPELEKVINVAGLNNRERKHLLTTSFRHYPHSYDYPAKIRHLAKRLSIAPNTCLQMGKRWQWRDWDTEQRAVAEAATATAEKLAATTQTAGTVVVLDQTGKEYSVTAFLKELRAFATSAISVSNTFTRVTDRMVSLIAAKIETHIAEAEATEWDEYRWVELSRLHKRMREYVEPSKAYTSPGSLAALLNALSFKENIPPERGDVDFSAFTLQSLQAFYIEQMGMSNDHFRDTAATEEVFAKYSDLPDISGRRPHND